MKTMSSVTQRILAGLGANALGQAVGITIQLVSLPVFLYRWDSATYGVWLLISALPGYLSMADVGMVTTAGNRMTMAMAQGAVEEANRIFQSALLLLTCLCGSLAAIVVLVCLAAPLPAIAGADERIALMMLCLGVLGGPFGGLVEAVFRATGRYPFAMGLAAGTRMLEWLGGLFGLWLWGSFAAVAGCALVARVLATVASLQWSRGEARGLRWGLAHARWREVRAMIGPSSAFMIFPLASALSLQGITLLVGYLFGPALVTVFSAYRTLARVTVQATSMVSHATWPEFSRLFGLGGAAAARPVYVRAELWGSVCALSASAALFPFGDWLMRVWTHSAVPAEPRLLMVLLAYAAVAGIGHMPRTFLMAINRHGGIALWNLVAGLTGVVGVLLAGRGRGLEGSGVAMLLAEMIPTLLSLYLVRQVLAEPACMIGKSSA